MQLARRKSTYCCSICKLALAAPFSTSSPRSRDISKPKTPYLIQRDRRRSEKIELTEDRALASGRWEKRHDLDRREWKAGARDEPKDADRFRLPWKPNARQPGGSFGRGPRDSRKFMPRSLDFATYDEALEDALLGLEEIIHNDVIFTRLHRKPEDLDKAFETWSGKLRHCMGSKKGSEPAYNRLRVVWPVSNYSIFKLHVKYSFYSIVMPTNFNEIDRDDQADLADLRYPTEWFPATRGFQREFHLHVGPTNSGKTYHALKRLEQAKTGLYAGPLRLLAHEVYMRLNAAGARCNLITGDERRAADDDPQAPMTSCTVEMVPLNTKIDVAVIDEIQMIGSEDRGWAWTQAVLGVMAKEVHCCGEERTVPIMQELVAMCGEKLIVHRYKRLSPLQMSHTSLDGDLRKLQKGDCLVAFKIMEIHALRQLIERKLRVKVAVIYGSLPPETRAQQAKLFNDPDSGYDILIASNAIGMGLNLSIKRLVFQTSRKFDGSKWSTLTVAETKQIAGRAGRYSTAEQDMKKVADSNLDIVAPIPAQIEAAAADRQTVKKQSVGLVTTLESHDFPIIEKLMNAEPEPIKSAGVQPPTYIIERFAKYFPRGTPFAYVLMKLNEISETSSRFYVCDLRSQLSIADEIEVVEGLTTTDRLIFCASPVEPRKPGEPDLARAYARLVAENRAASIVDVEELNFDLLDDDYVADRQYLAKLEGLHKGVIIWNWLSFRFSGVFINRELAQHVKELVEARIEEVLQKSSFDYEKMRKAREQAVLDLLQQEKEVIERRAAEDNEEIGHEEGQLDDSDLVVAGQTITLDRSEPAAADFEETILDETDRAVNHPERRAGTADSSLDPTPAEDVHDGQSQKRAASGSQ